MNGDFDFIQLNEEGIRRTQQVAGSFRILLERLEVAYGNGSSPSETEMARLRLQEACYWAKRAVSVQARFQKGAPPSAYIGV